MAVAAVGVALLALHPTPARLHAPSRLRSACIHCAESDAVAWEDLKATLDDAVPIFVLTDEATRPFSIQKAIPCFADPKTADAELSKAREENPELNLRLQSVGLGTALERSRLGRASLVPSAEDLAVARQVNPDGEDWDGGAFPLFGCQALQRKRRDGQMATPLWLSVEDAKVGLREVDPNRELDLDLVCTSLQRIVSLCISGEVGPVDFVPTAAAVKLTIANAARNADGELPEGVSRGAIKAALVDVFREDENDQYGLFG